MEENKQPTEEQPIVEQPTEEVETEITAEQALAQAQELIAAQNDKYLRLSAEFDNYRKRTIKEKAELIKSAGEKTITAILPVIDDMERAIAVLAAHSDAAQALEGVELIYNKFIKTLEGEGLHKIVTTDATFNTDFHEAIALLPAATPEQKGKIVDCVQTGYLLGDKVIRHAKVAVAE